MPSSTASETWSQTLSGWPSVTDSEVSRNEGALLKELIRSAILAESSEFDPAMKVGVTIPAYELASGRARSIAEMVEDVVAAERLGYDSVWVMDQLPRSIAAESASSADPSRSPS